MRDRKKGTSALVVDVILEEQAKFKNYGYTSFTCALIEDKFGCSMAADEYRLVTGAFPATGGFKNEPDFREILMPERSRIRLRKLEQFRVFLKNEEGEYTS